MPRRRSHRRTGRPVGRPVTQRDELGRVVGSEARLAVQSPYDPSPALMPLTPAAVTQATLLIENPEARRLLLAHWALGHQMQNPQSARSMAVRRQALHDLMLASGDIQEGGLRLQVQANGEGSGVQLVVIANGRGPAPPEMQAEVVDALPSETEPASLPEPVAATEDPTLVDPRD